MAKHFGFLFAALVSMVATQPAGAVTMFFDFGTPSSPSAASNYNDVILENNPQPIVLANTIDNSGNGTGIGLTVSGFHRSSNPNGTATPAGDAAAIFAPSALLDSAYTHVVAWDNEAALPKGALVFTGLDNSSVYDFTMSASRMGVGDNRETLYTATGSNTATATLNIANNDRNVVTIAGVSPNAGSITLTVEAGVNNTNSPYKFSYLGALRVVSSPAVPEPTTLGLVGLSALGLAFRRRSA